MQLTNIIVIFLLLLQTNPLDTLTIGCTNTVCLYSTVSGTAKGKVCVVHSEGFYG